MNFDHPSGSDMNIYIMLCVSQMQKHEVSRIPSTLSAIPQSPSQLVNIKYPKIKVDHELAFQPGSRNFHVCINYQF